MSGLAVHACVACGQPADEWATRWTGEDSTIEAYCRHCLNSSRGPQGAFATHPVRAGDTPPPPASRPPTRTGAVLLEAAEARPLPVIDIAELVRKGVNPPELLCDRLLYRGSLHSLAGQPEAGKSTLAYRWALDLIAQGENVVAIDVEAGPEQVAEKLVAFEADPDQLGRFTYVYYPGARWDAADLAGVRTLVAGKRPALVLLDSIGVALAQAGKDENHIGEVEPLYSAFLAIARADPFPATLLLDHVAKDGRGGRYARGSGAKLQLVDVALMVDVVRPFSREQSGLVRLVVAKDRRGYLARRHDVRVEVADGCMTLTTTASDPATADDGASLPPAAVKVLAALRGRDDPQTIRQLGDRMKRETGKALTYPMIRKQLSLLAEVDLADGEGESGKAKRWWALKTDDGGAGVGVPAP